MKRLIAAAAVMFALGASPALAVNDPLVPGDECSASDQAVGHPAFANQADNPQGANPPFSANNPGVSAGAKAGSHQQGTAHCPNAP